MGCGGSSEKKPKAPNNQPYRPPTISPEEQERRRKEKEEEQKWIEIAKQQAPPEPPVATKPTDPSNEESYKEYMRIRYEHEGWENQVLLLARRLRAQAQQQGQ